MRVLRVFGNAARSAAGTADQWALSASLGDQMNDWEKEFMKKMESLHTQSTNCLERFLQEDLHVAFESVSNFLSQWKFQTSTPQTQPGRRSFKFALTEEAYVLVTFHLDGVDNLECESEYGLPGTGRVSGTRCSVSLRKVDRQWGELCFQKALDGLLGKLGEADPKKKLREPALV